MTFPDLAPAHVRPGLPLFADFDEERDLLRRAQGGDVRARNRLIETHMRLVASIARRASLRGTSLEDAVHEGVVGIIEAIERFDTSRETRFSTYASYWIRDRIAKHSREARQMVRAPSTRAARTVLRGHGRAVRSLESTLGRAPTRAELAARLSVSEDDVAACEPSLGRSDIALESFEPDDWRAHVRDSAETPEEAYATRELAESDAARVRDALARLGERERLIIERRFLDDESASLAELGEHLGISRERARQIQEGARTKLQRILVD